MGRKKPRVNCRVGGNDGQLFRFCVGKPVTEETVAGLEDKVKAYFAANAPDQDRKKNQSSGQKSVAISFYLGSDNRNALTGSFSVSSAGWERDDLFNCLVQAQSAAREVLPA